ncbi:hypothetical protein ABZ747_24860 [Kitasatospora cineracea]|uniref:hypothetical protein n=1 Tax=Kitasatospora cineracea TaxID=88074 RepID=UPI00340BED2A
MLSEDRAVELVETLTGPVEPGTMWVCEGCLAGVEDEEAVCCPGAEPALSYIEG